MYPRLFLLLMGCLLLTSLQQRRVADQQQAPKVYALLVVNTQEANRSTDRMADLQNMKKFCTNIAEVLGYGTPVFTELIQSALITPANIDKYLNGLSTKFQRRNRDIFIFYFSGHGGNAHQKTPIFACSNRQYYPMNKLNTWVMGMGIRKPKTSLFIGDCCNNLMAGTAPLSRYNPASRALYEKLFCDFQGRQVIFFGAASSGQLSYSHPRFGSFFGTAFREGFTGSTSNDNRSVSWDKLNDKVATMTLRLTQNKQKPYYNRFISTDAE